MAPFVAPFMALMAPSQVVELLQRQAGARTLPGELLPTERPDAATLALLTAELVCTLPPSSGGARRKSHTQPVAHSHADFTAQLRSSFSAAESLCRCFSTLCSACLRPSHSAAARCLLVHLQPPVP